MITKNFLNNLYLVYKENKDFNEEERKSAVLKYLVETMHLSGNYRVINELKVRLRKSFFNNLRQRISIMNACHKGFDEFEDRYNKWLKLQFTFSYEIDDSVNNAPVYVGK